MNVVSDFILAFKTEFDYFLVPDCRFPNEINLLKEKYYDVYSILVERSEFDNGLTEEQKSHPSETALDSYNFDITLINQEGLDYVKNNAVEISKIIEFYSNK